MDKQQLERLAWDGVELPDGFGYADTLYFLMLRAACEAMKHTNIPREQVLMEKKRIENAVQRYRVDAEIAKHHADVLLRTGRARADYRKARNARDDPAALKAADRLSETLDNIPIRRYSNAEQDH